jgi:hypothetical protein
MQKRQEVLKRLAARSLRKTSASIEGFSIERCTKVFIAARPVSSPTCSSVGNGAAGLNPISRRNRALARCERHGKPSPSKLNYVIARPPVGHPNSGVICGRADCTNSALVWLEDGEEQKYQKGERVFSLPTAAARLKLN